jgi:hypothetical protein
MKESWWSHNSDKMILLVLVLILWFSTTTMAVHIFHHDTDSMEAIAFISFMTGSVSTVLGALILILTGRTPTSGQNQVASFQVTASNPEEKK